MKDEAIVKEIFKCPLCQKEVEVVSERSPGWGCEEKKRYVCSSCGWESKAAVGR